MTTDTLTDAASIAAAFNRLAEQVTAETELAPVVAVLDALTTSGGPLAALRDLLFRVSEALTDYEDESIDTAANRAEDASDSVADVIQSVTLTLSLIRPLAD